MDLLHLKENQARTLLIHYRWDVHRLIAVYVERGQTCLFSQAGVTVTEIQDYKPSPSSTVSCCICMEDEIPSDFVSTMDCGHCFCNDCKCFPFPISIMLILGQSISVVKVSYCVSNGGSFEQFVLH